MGKKKQAKLKLAAAHAFHDKIHDCAALLRVKSEHEEEFVQRVECILEIDPSIDIEIREVPKNGEEELPSQPDSMRDVEDYAVDFEVADEGDAGLNEPQEGESYESSDDLSHVTITISSTGVSGKSNYVSASFSATDRRELAQMANSFLSLGSITPVEDIADYLGPIS